MGKHGERDQINFMPIQQKLLDSNVEIIGINRGAVASPQWDSRDAQYKWQVYGAGGSQSFQTSGVLERKATTHYGREPEKVPGREGMSEAKFEEEVLLTSVKGHNECCSGPRLIVQLRGVKDER